MVDGRYRKQRGIIVVVLLLAAMLAAVTGCSGTKLVASWKDDAYPGRPAKVFVVVVSDDRGPRSLLEDEFVRDFKSRGTDAVASYTVFPKGGPKPTKDTVLAKAGEAGADAILVLKFIRKEAGDTHTPLRRYAAPQGFATDWSDYAGVSTDMAVRDVSYDYDVISMETTLYQLSTQAPIWSGLSDTTYQGSAIRQIKPFTVAIMKELAHAKLVR